MTKLSEDDLALALACVEIEPENDYELDDDPWQHLAELVEEAPARALAVCAEIARRSSDVTTLSGLGEEILEALLEAQPGMVDAVIAEARQSPGFRIALGFTWTGALARTDQMKLNQLLKN